MDFTRRELLIQCSKLLVLTGTAARALDKAGEPPSPGDTYQMAEHSWGMIIDVDQCIGCGNCIQACSYGCRYFHPQQEIADKCTLCYHRITQGLTTACCESCPTGARLLVDLKNPKDPVHEILLNNKIQVLKPQMATGAK